MDKERLADVVAGQIEQILREQNFEAPVPLCELLSSDLIYQNLLSNHQRAADESKTYQKKGKNILLQESLLRSIFWNDQLSSRYNDLIAGKVEDAY